MTDITPLTQSEINDALAQLKQLSEYPTPSTQYARVLRKYFASLVEALEKAQADGSEYAASERAEAVKNVALQDEIYGLKSRIAELESRTVTVKLPERYACELGYNAPDPNGDMLDRDAVIDALTAAGIKWEAE